LIGQATEQAEETGRAPGPAKPAASVEVIEMSFERENVPSASHSPKAIAGPVESGFGQTDPTVPKLGAISPPLPWPSPKSASVIRRVPPAAIPPLTPSVAARLAQPEKPQPQAVPQKAPVIAADNKSAIVEVVTPDPSVHKLLRRRENLQMFQRLRRMGKSACASSARTLSVFYGKAQSAYADINVGARLGQGRQLLQHSMLVAMTGCRIAGTRFRSVWKSTAPGIARFQSTSKASAEAVRSSIAQFGYSVQRVQRHRVRLRIKRSARIQAFIEHSRQGWNKMEESIRRDNRLLTSVGMAALSALLALAVLSELSHNAPGAHASDKSMANAPQHSSSAVNSRIVVEPERATPSSRSSQAAQAKSSAAQKIRRPESAPRTRRHNEHDDYVAPDTYHYYGQQGKSR
jgi:hypothetical protein